MMAQNDDYYLYKIVTFYGNLSKEGLKVNIDDGKSIERLKDANGDPIKFKTPAAALMYFLSEGWNLYINGTSTEGYSYQGTGGSVSTSYWIFRKPCTKEVFEKAVEEGIKNKIFLSFFHPIYRSYSCPKKQNMGDFLLFTTSVAHIPGATYPLPSGPAMPD